MTEDPAIKDVPSNPCCVVWKEKYTKLQQRFTKLEHGRSALREGVALFEQQITKLETEKINLKKAYEDERLRADNEKEERAKESASRISLENEISALKSEIFLLQQKGDSVAQDANKEVELLRDRVSEGEKETNRLKELLEKEKIRANSEKKKTEAEKKKANEAHKKLKEQKSRADEERRLASIEGKKAEENMLKLGTLKSEVDEARSKLEEATKKLEAERQTMIKEKKHADIEMAKAGEQRKLAEMNWKKAMDEKCRADYLSRQLEQDRQRIEKLQKEIEDHRSSKKSIKTLQKEREDPRSFKSSVEVPADLPDKQINTETVKLKSERQSKTLKRAANESQGGLEYSKFEEVNKRLEKAKQKVIREKKRADSEMRKAEEQRKFAKVYEMKAMEETHRADQVARELEVNRRRTEELQKEIQELVSSRTSVEPPVIPPDNNMNAETAKKNLLRKRLKFEKMQVKHAKEVAKLEIGRNNILRQEICRLKQEFVQFSQRLDILDNCISYSDEGIDDQAKISNVSKHQNLNLKMKLFGRESCLLHLDSENELIKSSCTGSTARDGSDPLKQTVDSTAPLLPISGGNYTESASGIDSKLEPLLKGSSRKMLESSAINSSMASFSDRSLVGSQERGAFSVTTSAKLAEKSNPQPTVSRMSDEVTKTRYNENLAAVAENSVRSPLSIDAVNRSAGHTKKRKRILDAVESIEHLYSEGQKWHQQIAEKLSVLNGMLHSRMDRSSEEGRCLVPYLKADLYGKQDRSHKKRKPSPEEEVVVQHLVNSNELKDRLGTKGLEESNICTRASSPGNNLSKAALAFNDEKIDSFRGNVEILGTFDEIRNGDYMKLLDLDNDVDEESYRIAIERPLSPTLPEIEFQSSETLEINNSNPLVVESSIGGFSNIKDNFAPCCNFDVMNVEIDSNKLKSNTSGISYSPLLHYNEGFIGSLEKFSNDENGNSNIGYGGSVHACKIGDLGAELGKSDTFISGNEGLKILQETGFKFVRDNLPKYCVVFSDTNDHDSMFRIFRVTRSCMAQCPMIFQTDLVVRDILTALLKAEDLSPKEKVCGFFSLLLHNVSGIVASGNFGNFSDRSSILFLDSFAGRMHEVLSDVEIRSMFAELCHLDELFALIEDFLITRTVLVYGDVSSESDGDLSFSVQVSSTFLLVAAAIILASICAAVDHIGFLCEASYNIFRMQKFDSSEMLTILHVFVHLCGSKYFTLDDYGLIMTVMKSLVIFLEKANLSTDSASCFLSLAETRSKLPSATKCPFAEGAISIDIVVSMLLEKLQNYALSGAQRQDSEESMDLLNSGPLYHKEKTEQNKGYGETVFDKSLDCNVVHCLNKFGMPAVQSKFVFDGTLCQLNDVLSLLELVACNMSWDWTCDNIVYQLLKLLDSCALENISAAIVVLLGQLGRLGIDANGHDDTGVVNLSSRLSAFLCQSASRKSGLPLQIATVTALLGLLPLTFEELINNSTVELLAVANQSIPAGYIRKWFYLLSDEEKSLSLRLVEASSVPSCRTR